MTNDKQIAKVLEHLRLAAEDPMWADHAEVSKALCAAAADEIERLQAERNGLRADAERYKWLRDRATSCHEQQNTLGSIHYPTTWRIVTGGSDTNIDEAIDAALTEKEQT